MKKYRVILIVFLLVSILLGIRFFTGDSFSTGAEKNAAAAFSGEALITASSEQFRAESSLLIELDEWGEKYKTLHSNVIYIQPTDILSREKLQLIKGNKGPVLLHSSDISLSARVWMLLAQKGIDALYILSEKKNIEQLNYEFRPEQL